MPRIRTARGRGWSRDGAWNALRAAGHRAFGKAQAWLGGWSGRNNWAMSESIDSAVVLKALSKAVLHRNPPADLLFHSDRGVQYAAGNFRDALARAGLVASMSRRANCYDNASMESLWSALKLELVYRRDFATRHQARTDIFDYIEVFNNRERIHTALGALSPTQFELKNH